jgi:hypothetical protein
MFLTTLDLTTTTTMILRYYDCDWSVPCIENEFLFTGTKEECVQYLYKHWSVDIQEYKDNLEAQALFCNYLTHIQIGKAYAPVLFTDEIIKELYENGKDWDDKCEWKNINPNEFIFNRDLIEILN